MRQGVLQRPSCAPTPQLLDDPILLFHDSLSHSPRGARGETERRESWVLLEVRRAGECMKGVKDSLPHIDTPISFGCHCLQGGNPLKGILCIKKKLSR